MVLPLLTRHTVIKVHLCHPTGTSLILWLSTILPICWWTRGVFMRWLTQSVAPPTSFPRLTTHGCAQLISGWSIQSDYWQNLLTIILGGLVIQHTVTFFRSASLYTWRPAIYYCLLSSLQALCQALTTEQTRKSPKDWSRNKKPDPSWGQRISLRQ